MQPETANININDAVLVKQCCRGDSAAMERLILRYQHRIYNTVLKICANTDDAAELTQETFVKVIENIDKFEGRSGFYTWAFRIAVNLALNYCKRSTKLGFSSLDAGHDDHSERTRDALKELLADDASPDPSTVAADKELCELIIKSLMKDRKSVV